MNDSFCIADESYYGRSNYIVSISYERHDEIGEIVHGIPVPNNGMTIPKDSIPKLIEALEKYLKENQNE